MTRISKAFEVARKFHKHQKRKVSGAPYFVHLLDTAKYLMYETDDEDVICAGILHDTLEDTTYGEDNLKQEFGERVYNLVKFCTNQENGVNSAPEEQKNSWHERKTRSIAKLKYASDDELLIYCADKLSNLLSIKDDLVNSADVWVNFNGSRDKIKWYYTEIGKALEPKLENRRIFKIYKNLLSIFDE